MTSDTSNLPEHVPTPPIEGRIASPSDDPVATRLRGFGPVGLLAIVIIVLTSVIKPLSALLVLLWAWRSHTPWREIGYVRPKSWIGSLALGIIFGCALKLLMKVIVMPLLPRNQFRLPLPGRKPGCTPRNGIHDDCRRLRRGNFVPRLPIRTPRQAFRDWGRRKSIHRPAHLGVVCHGPLLQ